MEWCMPPLATEMLQKALEGYVGAWLDWGWTGRKMKWCMLPLATEMLHRALVGIWQPGWTGDGLRLARLDWAGFLSLGMVWGPPEKVPEKKKGPNLQKVDFSL